jgi:LmbE family N-acetylglucosaminyl deacetylase
MIKLEIIGGRKVRIMFVGAHPDDIEPQAGGTIAKLTRKGHEVLIVSAVNTGGDISDKRRDESIKAAEILGAKIKHLGFDQIDFRFERKVVQAIDKVICDYKPDEIYTCWEYDSHQDHQVVTKSVLAASRKNYTNLFFYEPVIPGGITPHGFESNYFVDITETIEQKIMSVRAHDSQVLKYGDGWIDAIYGRARLCGFQINVAYAESFKAVKLFQSILEKQAQ